MSDTPPDDVRATLLVRFDARAGLQMLDVLRDEATSPEALEAYLASLHEHKLTELWACMMAVVGTGQLAVVVAEAVEEIMEERGIGFAVGGSFDSTEEAEQHMAKQGTHRPVRIVPDPSLPTTVPEPDAPTA